MFEIIQPTPRKSDKALIFQTHVLDKFIISQFEKIYNQVGDQYDIFVMTDASRIKFPCRFGRIVENTPSVPIIYVDYTELYRKYYITKKMQRRTVMYHSEHLPFVEFAKHLPDYAGFWRVEYDVHYEGDWSDILEDLSGRGDDLITASLLDHPDCRHYWNHWFKARTPVKVEDLVRAHHALMYMSTELCLNIGELSGDDPNQYRGHYEVLVPSIAAHNAYSISDIGGYSKYTPKDRWGKYYQNLVGIGLGCKSLSTFSAFGNFFDTEKVEGTLYHPVKVPKNKRHIYKL